MSGYLLHSMNIWIKKIVWLITLFWLALVASLWFFASEDNPQEVIEKQIERINGEKINEITRIKEKQTVDNLDYYFVMSGIQALEESLDQATKKASWIKWRMNWRNQCISIISWSLWSINPVDCEQAMQTPSFAQE